MTTRQSLRRPITILWLKKGKKVSITVSKVLSTVLYFPLLILTFPSNPLGALVGLVRAEDLDQTTDFNRISFSIISGSIGSFIIRTEADERGGYRGTIMVDPDIELDFESNRKQYTLTVEAADLEQKKASATVDVFVIDVNDERPEFKPTAPVTVKENTTISEVVGRFVGQDKDGNHSLVYVLESVTCSCNGSWTPCNWFILDPTGGVRVNPEATVDYEECTQAMMEAQVVDEFTEKGQNNSVSPGWCY